MSLPQILTARAVAQTCLDKWDKLGVVAGERACMYDYENGHGCAIGLSLNAEVLQAVHRFGVNGEPVQFLQERRLINAGQDDLAALITLQSSHDFMISQQRYKKYSIITLQDFRMLCEYLASGGTLAETP